MHSSWQGRALRLLSWVALIGAILWAVVLWTDDPAPRGLMMVPRDSLWTGYGPGDVSAWRDVLVAGTMLFQGAAIWLVLQVVGRLSDRIPNGETL